MAKINSYKPTESEIQKALLEWTTWMSRQYPELSLLYHIPNEGKRSYFTGAKMKAEGLKSGVPDLCLPVARGIYHGLYIEMKRPGNKPTDNQRWWLEALTHQGYRADVAYSTDEAINIIIGYLNSNK